MTVLVNQHFWRDLSFDRLKDIKVSSVCFFLYGRGDHLLRPT